MNHLKKSSGLFITGTDTEVGKTYVGAQIATVLHQQSFSVKPRKPIESGCRNENGHLHPSDATHYFESVHKSIPLTEICPFRFEPPISPQRAARLVNQPIRIEEAMRACLKNVSENDFLIVEGAGGFYSPLCQDGLNADLAQALQLPVLLIANDQLGCMNHILLTVQAIQQRNLTLKAIVLNDKTQKCEEHAMNNAEDLKALLDIPIFSIGYEALITSHSKLFEAFS